MIPSPEKKKYWEVIGGKKGCDTCLNTGNSAGCAGTRLIETSIINRPVTIFPDRLIIKNTMFSDRYVLLPGITCSTAQYPAAKVHVFFWFRMPTTKSNRLFTN
jgi:hypothetical protein